MTIRGIMAAGAMVLLAAPALAEPAATAPRTLVAPLPAPDPARLAAARPVIERVWPLGTYARLMHVTMDQMVQGMMARMFDMTPDDLVATMGLPPELTDRVKMGAKGAPGETLGQMAAKEDPAFRERMRITMQVMGDEMARLMGDIEPQLRDALAASYARRFSVAELDDLHRFFATPTGTAYARDSLLLMMGPDMMNAMTGFVPRMIRAMPQIMAKVMEATKHLPPAKKKKDGAGL